MAKQERTRKSAPHNRVKSFNLASEVISPTSELSEAEFVCFEAIIASRERSTWLPVDIRTATHLAKLEHERDSLREGYMEDMKGDPSGVPFRFRMFTAVSAQVNKIRRDLGLTASQRGISGEKQKKRNAQDADSMAKMSNMSKLISRPNVAG